MENWNSLYKAFVGNMWREIPFGRNVHSSKDNIKRDVKRNRGEALWIQMSQNRIQWCVFTNTVIRYFGSYKAQHFLTNLAAMNLSRKRALSAHLTVSVHCLFRCGGSFRRSCVLYLAQAMKTVQGLLSVSLPCHPLFRVRIIETLLRFFDHLSV